MTESSQETDKKKPGWMRWLVKRMNLRPIGKHIVYHRVTKAPWYYGEGAALLLIISILFLTGMFMALTYSPSPVTAYESVLQITEQNYLGWFVRALHYWAAGMMIVLLVYHVLRHIALGGYLPPREGIWLIGVTLFVLVISTSFIGYTLRWDERSVYALGVALNIFYKIPLIGEEVVLFVQGGEQIGRSTLSRLYAVHVLFVPISLMLLLGYHLYLVLTFGVTTPLEKKLDPETADEQIRLRTAEKESRKFGHDFFPFMAATSGSVSFIVFAVVLALALIEGPQALYPEANLTEVSQPIEEWWFHWYSALTALLPPAFSDTFHWLFPLVILLILVALPFVDRRSHRGPQRRPIAVVCVTLVVIALLSLTGLRLKSPWTAWPQEQHPPLPPGFELSESAAQGRLLFVQYGCYNCHAVGGRGSGFAPNLTDLQPRRSQQFLRDFILHPPEGTAMPSYRDHMPGEDLNKVVDYVLSIQTFPRQF